MVPWSAAERNGHRHEISDDKTAAGRVAVRLPAGDKPAPAGLAAVDVTKGNSAQENAQLLQQLEALTGGESEAAAALATMRDLGLVDENGNLLQTRTVTLDGQEMTLDQVRDYLEDCKEKDLDKMVEVDGTQVTLENLATMMAIEAEIDRVRETYFSGETPDLTEEQ